METAMSDKLLFSKLRSVKSPIRAHETDAGIDFFLPDEFTNDDIQHSFEATKTHIFIDGRGNINIPPHGAVLLPSGLKVIVPKGYALIFFNKSGVATKKHLLRGACVADCGFQGEILFNFVNTSNTNVELSPGEKIIQGVLIQVGDHQPVEVDDIMNYTNQSERGEGGFGSSGTK